MIYPIRIAHMIGSLNIGGSQAMVMNIYRNIDRNKFQFDFILDSPNELDHASEVEKLGGRIFSMPKFKGYNLIEVIRSWDIFFSNHPEYRILHSHVRSYASLYLPIAKKYGVMTIIHSHNTSNGSDFRSYIKKVFQYPLRYQADYYMACSKSAAEWLFGSSVLNLNNYMMLPNSINVNMFSYNETVRNEIREELGLSDCIVIGHTGRMVQQKNHKFLIEIFAEVLKIIPTARLMLVGDGELRQEIESCCVKYNMYDKVIFVGSKMDVHKYYQAMDVFVFPSLSEGLGIVTIEAQTSGLECVVSDEVPVEADVGANLLHRLSLNDSSKVWAEYVASKCRYCREDKKLYAIKAGYDISCTVNGIENVYSQLHKIGD